MEDKHFILEDSDHFIVLNQKGKIVIESVFQKNFDGDMKMLLSCIEDNIIDCATLDTHGYDAEKIDWSMVYDDYRAAIDEREDK